MRNRPIPTDAVPPDGPRPFVVARRVLAMIVVGGGLLALATWYKHNTCGCSGGLPYTTIGLWAGIAAAVSLAVYVALGFRSRSP